MSIFTILLEKVEPCLGVVKQSSIFPECQPFAKETNIVIAPTSSHPIYL